MRAKLGPLGVLLICASVLACGGGETKTAAPSGSVGGTLTNLTTGQPVAGYTLGLGHEAEDASGVGQISRETSVATVTTDGAGRFDFRGVAEGTYIVVATSGAPLVPKSAYDAAKAGGSGGGAVFYVSSSAGTIAVPWISMKFQAKADAPTEIGQIYCTDDFSCPK